MVVKTDLVVVGLTVTDSNLCSSLLKLKYDFRIVNKCFRYLNCDGVVNKAEIFLPCHLVPSSFWLPVIWGVGQDVDGLGRACFKPLGYGEDNFLAW